jgi:hypothetical protein
MIPYGCSDIVVAVDDDDVDVDVDDTVAFDFVSTS